MIKPRKVAILGGGVAGLSTAHQLVQANLAATDEPKPYEVHVFDAAPGFGGKCRTFESDDGLAGEHGFRFFPGFYRYVIRTMSEIKILESDALKDGKSTVYERLVPLEEAGFYAEGLPGKPQMLRVSLENQQPPLHTLSGNQLARWLGLGILLALAIVVGWSWWLPLIVIAALLWVNLRIALAVLWMQFALRGKIPARVRPHLLESIWMFLRLVQIASSSRQRMVLKRDEQSWWSYVQAWRRTPAFRLTLAAGLTRTFVATRAEQMSSRTGGAILTQLLYDINPYLSGREVRGQKNPADRVLSAPTNRAWIDPWVAHLEKEGVIFNEDPKDKSNPRWGTDRGPLVQSLKLGEPDSNGVHKIESFGFGIPASDAFVPRLSMDDPVASLNRSQFDSAEGFDEYVLALSGTAVQQVLANSADLLAVDQPDAQPDHEMNAHTIPPRLAGVFGLEFGWMSGIVYHLEEAVVGLPRGHLLCLESEYALTVLDQKPNWTSNPKQTAGTILSVNLSDWFTPAKSGLPARYKKLDAIADEVWNQMVAHIPALQGLKPDTSSILFDRAIADPEAMLLAVSSMDGLVNPANLGPLAQFRSANGPASSNPVPPTPPTSANSLVPNSQRVSPAGQGNPPRINQTTAEQIRNSLPPSVLVAGLRENMALNNGERLLINTSRSWANRPSTTTAISNLFVAGDYVRTYSDFASMEAADESARWVALALWDKHGVKAPPKFLAPSDLEVPVELKTYVRIFKRIDRALSRVGMPHLLTVISGPIGFLARLETAIRSRLP